MMSSLKGTFLEPKTQKGEIRKSIPKYVRVKVWAKYIGMNKTVGKCYACGTPIHITDFQVGHNRAVAKGGSNNINNLRPICRGCNLAMGTMSIDTYTRTYLSTDKKSPRRTLKPKPKRSQKKHALSLRHVLS